MAGLPAKEMDASSIKTIIENPQNNLDRTVRSYFDQGNFAVINKKWRLIQYKDGSQELYNRIKDPNEWTNLIHNSEYSSVVKKMQKQIPNWSTDK
jgi:hypothetical protein